MSCHHLDFRVLHSITMREYICIVAKATCIDGNLLEQLLGPSVPSVTPGPRPTGVPLNPLAPFHCAILHAVLYYVRTVTCANMTSSGPCASAHVVLMAIFMSSMLETVSVWAVAVQMQCERWRGLCSQASRGLYGTLFPYMRTLLRCAHSR